MLVQGNKFWKICKSDAVQEGDQTSDVNIQATIMCWSNAEKDYKKTEIDQDRRKKAQDTFMTALGSVKRAPSVFPYFLLEIS